MTTKSITVLDPTGEPVAKEIPTTLRLHDLNDKAFGFLWNTKPNGDVLLLRIKEQLSQRFHVAGFTWRQKSIAAGPTDITIMEELLSTSDLVINAIGD